MPSDVARQQQPTKRDIEQLRARADLAQANASVERWRHIGPAMQGTLWICSLAVPLLALRSVMEPLAGKTTVVNANIVISITIAISIAVNIGQFIKSSSQRAEIQRMRERSQRLEGESGQLP